MNINEITSLITKAAEAVEANEKLALPILAAKARREANANPTDVPLITASQVLTKMASDKTFISKDELRNILQSFGASHSKLAQVFSDELGKVPERKPQTFVRDSNEGFSLDRDYQKFSDPLLANALSGAFSPTPEERLYSVDAAQKAQRAANAQLMGIGIVPKEIKTFAGRKDIIICQAVHETPKGISNVLIPVELQEGKAILPTMFFSRKGFENLEKGNYADHMISVAGKSFRVDGAKLLDILETVKNGSQSIANEVEMAAIKVASDKGSPALDIHSVLYAKLDEEYPDVQLPKAPSTEESKFAERLGKPEGIARFIHGDRVVEAGRSLLIRKLAEFGHTSVQVKVGEVEKDKILYAVSIGAGTGLTVPLEVLGNNVMPPKILFGGGTVTAFSKQGIAEVIKEGTGGNKRALAVASPCYDMKPSELVDVVKESINEGNFLRAEEAINVLGEVDKTAQNIAIAYMMTHIYEPGQKPGEDMDNMVRAASQPVRDTPQFMTHKIFFPEGA